MESKEGYVKDLCDWMRLRNYSAATISAYGSFCSGGNGRGWVHNWR